MNAVKVLVFGRVREVVAAGSVELPAPAGTTAGSILDTLAARHPELLPWRPHLRVAVNREYARDDAPVAPGDEVAVIPPVSGG